MTFTDPRWKTLLARSISENIGNDKSTLYYVLTTPSPSSRYVVHRGFLNEQRADTPEGVEAADKNFARSDSLLTTTDIRAPKAVAIQQAQQKQGKAEGCVAWWIEGAQLQFRISGTLHLISSSQPTAPSFLSPRSSKNETFDWAAERSRIFAKLSPALRASFARPTPGSKHPMVDVKGAGEGEPANEVGETEWPKELPSAKDEKEADEEQKRLLALAEKNFALVVLHPTRVDVVDLARDRRSLFERSESDKEGGEWSETQLVP